MGLITNKVLRNLAEGHNYAATESIADNIDAVISLVPQKTEPAAVKITGHLRTKSPSKKIDGIGAKTVTAYSYNTLQIDIDNLCRSLLKAYNEKMMPIVHKERTPKEFAEKVLSIPDIFNPSNFQKYVPRGWKGTTAENAVTYYATTFGALYDSAGWDVSTADLTAFRNQEVDRIYLQQYKRPCADGKIVQRRRESILAGLNTRFAQARAVQMYLLEHYPEYGWPETPIPVMPYTRAKRKENIKTTSYQQYIMLMTLLKRCCTEGIPHAFAASGTVLCGMRIGESCAPLLGDFFTNPAHDVGIYHVQWQIDKYENRATLKNTDSERYLSYGRLMIDLIDLRRSQLAALSYTEEEIDKMPYGAKEDAPYDYLRKTEVSAFVRELLILIGCDDTWLEREAAKMFAASAASGNSEDLDIGAHEMRSTIATFAGNGGMDPIMLDAYLGHANPKVKKGDYASFDVAEQVVAILERSIPYGSLCETRNPRYNPIHVEHATNYNLMGNTMYQFVADEDMWLEFDITALEPNGGVTVLLPASCEESVLQRRVVPDTLADRKTRPILANLPDSDEVEQWINEARTIDLTDIVKKYGGMHES